MKKILVADVPQMDLRYATALSGWQIDFVRTLAQARQALGNARHDLVALGVYFDDSQMFDLLRIVRADAAHATVPVVCVRGRPGFTAVSSRSLEIAVKALGADEFIELAAGENSNGALRNAAEKLTSA